MILTLIGIAVSSFALGCVVGGIVGFKAYGKGLKRAVEQGRLKMELYW